jgi:hypothetical protein
MSGDSPMTLPVVQHRLCLCNWTSLRSLRQPLAKVIRHLWCNARSSAALDVVLGAQHGLPKRRKALARWRPGRKLLPRKQRRTHIGYINYMVSMGYTRSPDAAGGAKAAGGGKRRRRLRILVLPGSDEFH